MSDVADLEYLKPMGNSDHLIIEFASAKLLTTMMPTRLMKKYQKLGAAKALGMADKFSWIHPIENYCDVSILATNEGQTV